MRPPIKNRGELVRFSLAVRLVHASTAALMLVCIATAAILYNGSLAVCSETATSSSRFMSGAGSHYRCR